MLTITTPYGETYKVNDKGEIYRPHTPAPYNTPSGQWLMLGIVEVRRFTPHAMIPLATITPEWLKANPLLFKNGRPRYTIVDRDHGTLRIHGNTKHHGIRSMYFDDGRDRTPEEIELDPGRQRRRTVPRRRYAARSRQGDARIPHAARYG
jgi:hypothetical protein